MKRHIRSNKRNPAKGGVSWLLFRACCLVSTPWRSHPHLSIMVLQSKRARDRQHLADWHKICWITDGQQNPNQESTTCKHEGFVSLESRQRDSSGTLSPRALRSESLRNHGMPVANLLLTNVPVVNEKLCNRASVAISRDAANTNWST